MLCFFIYFFLLVKDTAWQHGVQAVQQPRATLSTQYEPLNKNKQLLHTIASTILVRFYSFFSKKRSLQPVAKKVKGRQQRALFKFLCKKQHARGSNIKYRPVID